VRVGGGEHSAIQWEGTSRLRRRVGGKYTKPKLVCLKLPRLWIPNNQITFRPFLLSFSSEYFVFQTAVKNIYTLKFAKVWSYMSYYRCETHLKKRTQVVGVWDYNSEKNIWASEGGNERRMETSTWAGYVACIREMRSAQNFCQNLKGKCYVGKNNYK
jgi:hypothetical protein